MDSLARYIGLGSPVASLSIMIADIAGLSSLRDKIPPLPPPSKQNHSPLLHLDELFINKPITSLNSKGDYLVARKEPKKKWSGDVVM
jgi:hypothetical protein